MMVLVRNTRLEDYAMIADLCREVYVDSPPWKLEQIESHLNVFPEGQFVAEDVESGKIVGMSASLVVLWDDYRFDSTWREFTDRGTFQNHDLENGRTLYGAEVMVSPRAQGRGIGKLLYVEREKLVRRLKLLRIRAGARLRGYGTYAGELSPEDYVLRVIEGKIFDPTLSFQLKRGFDVLAVVSDYLLHDAESLGYAAVIEWINDEVAVPSDYTLGDVRFRRKR